jgi:hypothetical protein
VEILCKECSAEFNRSPSEIKKSVNHFCSRSCANTFNNRVSPKRKRTKQCAVCDELIYASRVYCSSNCRKQAGIDSERSVHGQAEQDSRRKELVKQRVVVWRQRTKLRAMQYKGGCCYVCGYRRSVRAMCFHHLDPSTKTYRIASGNTIAWDRLIEELDKCVLLCANCHAEVHDGLVTLDV